MNTQKYLDLFEYIQDESNANPRFKEGFWAFKYPVCKGHPVNGSWTDCPTCMLQTPLFNLIHASDLDSDSAYTFTVEALQAILDMQETGQAFEDGNYSEAPIYTSELMDWMARGTNYTLIDDIISESWDFDHNTSIIPVIQLAYSKAWEDHYYKILEVIQG